MEGERSSSGEKQGAAGRKQREAPRKEKREEARRSRERQDQAAKKLRALATREKVGYELLQFLCYFYNFYVFFSFLKWGHEACWENVFLLGSSIGGKKGDVGRGKEKQGKAGSSSKKVKSSCNQGESTL